MNDAKKLIGVLYFSDSEPHVIGHITIGDVHYEIAGVRRSPSRTDITGRKIEDREGGHEE